MSASCQTQHICVTCGTQARSKMFRTLAEGVHAGLCVDFGKLNQLRLTRLCSFHQRRKSPVAAQYARTNASTCQEVDRGGLMS